MITKKCARCGKRFDAVQNARRYCSKACADKARRETTEKRHADLAKRLGIPVAEVRRRIKNGMIMADGRKRPGRSSSPAKGYLQIQLENRRRKVQSGWRGQVVLGGGGGGVDTTPPLTMREMERTCCWS